MSFIESILKKKWLWWLVIAAGVALRLRLYLLNRSFSADEASLAFNIVTRTFSGLTQTLDYQQGAPLGFLFIVKILLLTFGNNEYALRLLPLISGILALIVLYLLAKKHFGAGGLFAVVAFSLSWSLIHYSTEFKQYSTDAFIALLLIYLASRCLDETPRGKDFLLLGVFGAAAIWVSHPAFFILAGIGLLLLIEKFLRGRNIPLMWIFALGFAWLASFALEYWVSLQYLIFNKYLYRYWSKAFMPMPPWSDWRWFPEVYISLAEISLSREIVSLVLIALSGMVGVVALFRRNRTSALLFTLPVVMVALACALQRYPLRGRFMLFLIPFLLFFVTEGIVAIYHFASKWRRGFAFALSSTLVLWLLFTPIRLTFNETKNARANTGMRPVIEYVSVHAKPADIIYVYHSADPVFHYYAPLSGIDLQSGNVIIGADLVLKKRAFESFLNDINSLAGRGRVWFIFSDIVGCGGCDGNMQAFYVDLLNKHGTLLEQVNNFDANAYLYDMGK
jgi:hypothetical protein